MTRLLSLLLFTILSLTSALAQTVHPTDAASDDYNLGFETAEWSIPNRWYSYYKNNGYKILTDTTEKHSGKNALLIEKFDLQSETNFAQSNLIIPAKYDGKELEVRFYMKLDAVSGFASMAVATDDEDYDRQQYVHMEYDKIKGTRDWKQYRIKIPLPRDARYIRMWPTLSGRGKLWVDDVQILIDGKDISLAQLKTDFNPIPNTYVPYGNNPAAGAYLKIKDANLYYESYGKGEPMLLLHGNSQSIVALKKQIIELSKYYRVIAVDTRGQGKSTDLSNAALTYDLFAEDMKSILDSLHISKTNILGWSDGGNTGLIMAYKYPSYVNKLAVMGACMFPTEEAVPKSILKEVAKTIEGLKKKSDEKSKIQLRLFTLLLNEPHMTTDDLKRINAPVLVMAGEKDMILEKHTRFIAEHIPSSKLFIFNGATHYAPVEVKSEFNAQVKDFFKMP